MDFTKLRAAALKDGDDEEAVTVNTRALIDKVLARYSGEWTTLRELIQNAADAQATTVTIKFETLPSPVVPLANTTNKSEILKHVLLHHTLRRLLVTNNGQPFGVNDWSRLKRIAEGNPDETKIGAFGVGFYSVFADCEEPFVSSGKEAMAFYWKANSLFTRRLQLPPEESNPNTSFVLDYRNTTTPMPNLLSICQFLATSLTFVALQKIELQVDDWKIISLEKKSAPSIEMPIARDVETKTKDGLMRVQSMDRESVQMDAIFMNVVGWKPSISASTFKPSYDSSYGTSSSDVPSLRSFFSRLTASTSHAQLKTKAMKEEKALQEVVLEDLTAMTVANVFLRVTTAVVKTSVSSSFAAELERATKKPPPKTTKLAILTSSYDEAAALSKDNLVAKSVDVFSSVLPGKKPGGRIFIGFPTHQTTGAGMHLSAPSVIPTVERESIDLNARWVRTWNLEMLRVAGIMARLAFTSEMSDLSTRIKRATELNGHGTKVTKAEIDQFMPEALHNLKSFTFGESTPSSQVSQIIEEAFWTAYKKPYIEIYSTRGILPTTKVRLATEDLSGFVEGIPVVPSALVDGNFVNKLKDFGLITEITFSDVKQELEAKALTKEQLVQFIGWAGKKAITGDMDLATVHSLMDVAVAMTGDADSGEIMALGTIINYLSVSKIPAEFPIPPTTIPFQFTRTTTVNELQALGWEPLEIVPWLRYLIESNSRRPDSQNLTTSIAFAASVLQVLSKAWDGLSPGSKTTVVSLLQPLSIIPTKAGMKKPGDSFFASVKLFDDLPTVTSCPGVKEKFFAAIGVRKTVDLETIFTRLLAPTAAAVPGEKVVNYRHMEVIKYLASVKDDIPKEEIQRLRNSQICPAEAGPKGLEPTQGTARLYRVSELFEPKDSLRDLSLPIIQWPGPPGSYRPNSVEGRFLALLGLRTHPAVPELIDMMASSDATSRVKSMNYFISNHHMNGYAAFDLHQSNKPFLPLQGSDRLVIPSQCFTNERCLVLGFSILRKDLSVHANKFGVAIDPPMSECIQKLVAVPPRSKPDATALFGYFASRLGEISQQAVAVIAESRIVPVAARKQEANSLTIEKPSVDQADIRHLTPKQCYLGSSSAYSEIFDFVDFGSEANTFLLKCGSKNEPTTIELANLACREPARLLGILQGYDKYLDVLRKLADELPQLKRDKELFKQMKRSKFLLGTRVIAASKDNRKSRQLESTDFGDDSEEEEMEDAPIKQWQLEVAGNIIVNDDYVGYRLFKGYLICAPEEEKLEAFYIALGALTIRSLIQEDLRLGELAPKQDTAAKLRLHLLERAKLFLHEIRRESIKHDGRWLEKNLAVKVVTSINLRRSLRGHSQSHNEKRSAALDHDKRTGWTLYVAHASHDTFQISQAVSDLLLERPSQSASLTFEQFLNLSLLQLRNRGYNVERILRAKAAEQRMAEEERKKQMAIEQQQIQEQEEQWKQQGQLVPATPAREENMPMPGGFGSDSPENSPVHKPRREKERGSIFSNFTKRLGINSSSSGGGSEAQEQLQNFLGGGSNAGGSNTRKTLPENPPSYDEANKGTEKVSSPAAVQQNLHNAIQSSRAFDSSTLFSPPRTETVKEQATYCDSTPSQNISFLADASNGTRIFVSKTLTMDPTLFLTQNVSALNAFSLLLQDICDVYALPRRAMHIFYDESGGTIAFNSGGAIFCNFRFFEQLHVSKMLGANSGSGEGKGEAAAYWWIVIAHELAHNIVKEHNAEHSFYTEMLAANNFPKMMARCAAYIQASTSSSSVGGSVPPYRLQIQNGTNQSQTRSLLD
ncbi:related to NUO-14 NADH2 dehydrogenase (ubiquinone) 14K chain [Rhynchosporium secalis]|uniref:Related to NUO-14 NADH2 dehydrogenase (Ubiquinone) 14K chain n=1 Tax=Rhynchosporium secalis TaxID=38038 RepID=A0A1E1MM51_RHYSE|nr:related to NUO-14 NADH2 dehydrogenase (ubiquinone) 14K chain [Rhynchosporium secalis]